MKKYISVLLAASALALAAEAQTPTFTVTLTWTPPTTHTDGSPLLDLAGYTLYYSSVPRPAGCDSPTATQCGTWISGALTVDIAAPSQQRVLTNQNLTPATQYYFSMVAKKSTGVSSGFSNQASKLTPDPRIPGAPTSITVDIVFNAT